MPHNLPYVTIGGTLTRVLEKIKTAAVPERFTQDFLATKLGFKGGTPKTLIPFLKKIGFLGSDGAPTDLYKRFRNPAQSGAAMATAMRNGYKTLYEMNEYVHDANDTDLKGLVVQATGAEQDSRVVQAVIQSFKALKGFAKFNGEEPDVVKEETEGDDSGKDEEPPTSVRRETQAGINLAYTINLNLPATTDVAVFDAIFKSLREHLLRP
jgi:uncharacterized protein DUF5343